MVLVNARLPFILVDSIWYRPFPNNIAVLTIGTKTSIASKKTADRLRLTIINRDRTRTNETTIIQQFIQYFTGF